MLDRLIKNAPTFIDILPVFIDILDNSEIAALREVDRATNKALDNYFSKLALPYRSIFHFFLNNHQFFLIELDDLKIRMQKSIDEKKQEGFDDKTINDTIIPKKTNRIKDLIRSCWDQYYGTYTQSISIHPALIYKLRDKRDGVITKQELLNFKRGEKISAVCRLYRPRLHSWTQNLCWLLGLVHKKRSFIVFSNINKENIYRINKVTQHSAFAREIASLIKAGYKINLHSGFLDRISLFPETGKDYLLDLMQLNMATDKIDEAIQKVVDRADMIAGLLGIPSSYSQTLYSLDIQSKNSDPQPSKEGIAESSTSFSSGSLFSSNASEATKTHSNLDELLNIENLMVQKL